MGFKPRAALNPAERLWLRQHQLSNRAYAANDELLHDTDRAELTLDADTIKTRVNRF